MDKAATQYLEIHPWEVTERGFHKNRSRVSESVFALGNEFMGVRGYFEEGYGGDRLVGSYFNGVFDEHALSYPNLFSGFPTRTHFMVNSVDWLYARVVVGGKTLDLAASRVSQFRRTLDLRAGTVTRSFVWRVDNRKRLRVTFTRFVSMAKAHLGAGRIELEPLDFSGRLKLTLGLDFSPPHEAEGRSLWKCLRKGRRGATRAILGQTIGSGQKVLSAFRCASSVRATRTTEHALKGAAGKDDEKFVGVTLQLPLTKGRPVVVDRLVANFVEKRSGAKADAVWKRDLAKADRLLDTTFDAERARHAAYWDGVWKAFDVTIDGDPANEQGTRFCIFQLHQTYHGVDPRLNVGAKGLTGEVYGGLAFWDTEGYCLPYFVFTNPAAARNLLRFRYETLPQAKERARQLGCAGARYPMTTIDGTEACGVWHHGDLEIHVPAAVAYGIWHYAHVTGDREFLYAYGLEMLVEISRFFASHGAWSPTTGEFGLWGVMGADEFHMMVHNNAYTNAMAKKTFEWTLDALDELKRADARRCAAVAKKLGVKKDERAAWKRMAKKMRLQRDAKTGLIEQHDGYFDLPHVDLTAIPPERLPIVKHTAYIARSRFDWIKQPDVLLLPFFFSRDYSLEEKRVNYEYYEPRCIHESSLSPGVHSILAAELGMHRKAFEYVQYASRLDLDDYNGNTHQGLHMTSMAAAWMSLVYGFGGMRSDGPALSFTPSIPAAWDAFSFRIRYRGALMEVRVDKRRASFMLVEGEPVAVEVYGERLKVTRGGVERPVPAARAPRV